MIVVTDTANVTSQIFSNSPKPSPSNALSAQPGGSGLVHLPILQAEHSGPLKTHLITAK